MIKPIANKKVEVTKEEYEYYLQLEKTFGKEVFLGLFTSDSDGLITSITPSIQNPIELVILFFFMNLMMNQRLRQKDLKIEKLETRIKHLEDKSNGIS